ncbi:MAG: type III-B CRISPR module RAMP protein Cmr4, partial [Methanomicrobiales archaeon HGW-Methanomicrobiales-5]
MNEPNNYLALCLDPVHVGTGAYSLGRVDMSIVREPATGIPKIPGTSLAGVVRAYAELAKAENNTLPDIIELFGTAEGDQGRQGMLRFYDAEIVLFPVRSSLGTVWVSTIDRIRRWLHDCLTEEEGLTLP